MNPKFNEIKTTQAAAYLIKKRGGEKSYMKLIKLLYFADREALTAWGRPITFDRYVSMDHGPVLSQTYELITDGVPPGQDSAWIEHIKNTPNYSVSLIKDPGIAELSQAEMKLLDKIFSEYGSKNRWDLVEIVHQLPEWENPHGSSIPIQYSDILKAANKTPLEISAVESELESLAFAHEIFTKK
jgi:uncharacterized phage-associated protein